MSYSTISIFFYQHILLLYSVYYHILLPAYSTTSIFLCPWDFPGKNTGVGCHFLLQEIFPTQGLNSGLPHCRQTLYHLSQWESHYQHILLLYSGVGLPGHILLPPTSHCIHYLHQLFEKCGYF